MTRDAKKILSVNYQQRCSNVTFDRADLIDGASSRDRKPDTGNGTVEKGPNGAIRSLRSAFYTENYSQISGNIFKGIIYIENCS